MDKAGHGMLASAYRTLSTTAGRVTPAFAAVAQRHANAGNSDC